MTDYPKIDDKLIDSIIQDFEKYDETNLHTLLSRITNRNIGFSDSTFLSKIDEQLSKNYKYAKATCTGYHYYKLTDIGKEAKDQGGHIEYIKKLKEKHILEKERQERKDKTEELDLKKKRWEYKFRKAPYIFSSLAFIGTVISIIISYKSLKKKQYQQDLQPMQEQIQQLKDRIKLLDSLVQLDTPLKKRN